MKYIVRVQFHDYEPTIEYIDTNLLDKNSFVDSELLKAINNKETECFIDASNWEDDPVKFPFPDGDIGISEGANIKKPKKFDGHITLIIDFDC